mmetsp:Transcript_4031/g.11665  ORF Transcript_4031/g.11665 Transcript_4031/m.11665 type:complete len:268 (-) Transcript_4031:53-856(-)
MARWPATRRSLAGPNNTDSATRNLPAASSWCRESSSCNLAAVDASSPSSQASAATTTTVNGVKGAAVHRNSSTTRPATFVMSQPTGSNDDGGVGPRNTVSNWSCGRGSARATCSSPVRAMTRRRTRTRRRGESNQSPGRKFSNDAASRSASASSSPSSSSPFLSPSSSPRPAATCTRGTRTPLAASKSTCTTAEHKQRFMKPCKRMFEATAAAAKRATDDDGTRNVAVAPPPSNAAVGPPPSAGGPPLRRCSSGATRSGCGRGGPRW